VVTLASSTVGTVAEVRLTGGGFLLVIPDPTRGGEILVPAVAPILAPDDGLEGDLVIDPPEGLLDVHLA
jgi:ribosomal 30S subunit maturation factor RimM